MLQIQSGWSDDEVEPLLALNQSALPAVNSLSDLDLRLLLAESFFQGLAYQDSRLAGFLIAFLPGAGYRSDNYRWFCDRYRNFAYIDRIVIERRGRGHGIGKALYRALCDAVPEDVDALACEVNLRPPNPQSLVFHQRLGFVEVGQQELDDAGKRVSLLVKTLD